jgi:hypothetical protein
LIAGRYLRQQLLDFALITGRYFWESPKIAVKGKSHNCCYARKANLGELENISLEEELED